MLVASMADDERFRIEKYNERNFAVYDGEELVVLAVYRKGAIEVVRRLKEIDGGTTVKESPLRN